MTDLDALVAQYTAAGGQIQEIPEGHRTGLPHNPFVPADERQARLAHEHARPAPHDKTERRRGKYLKTTRDNRT